jgi:hypothetical protein
MIVTLHDACEATLKSIDRFRSSFGEPYIGQVWENACWFLVGYGFPGYDDGIEGIPVVLVSKETGKADLSWFSPEERRVRRERTAGMIRVESSARSA